MRRGRQRCKCQDRPTQADEQVNVCSKVPPKEIYEAARLDGATWWQVYRRMTMPLSGPTIATASLMLFIHQWDAFFWPLVAASREDLAVVQVAIARNMTMEQANWGALFASASSAVLVEMVPFLFLQRYYIRVVATQAERWQPTGSANATLALGTR